MEALARSFEDDGWGIARGLVPEHDIDALVDEYRRAVVPSRERFFRQCRGNRWEKNEIDAYGHVRQSFLDVHDFAVLALRSFSERVRAILCGASVASAVRELTKSPDNKLVLSMMFDANVGTPPHQDGWGIDSSPAGQMIGAWFALEDIDERAGRFYVMRGTHGRMFDIHRTCMDRSNAVYLRYARAHPEDIEVPALRKGDAIFWSSTVLHGAKPTLDPRHSRKSLTGHYIPAHCRLGNMFTDFCDQPSYERSGHMEVRKTRARHRPVFDAAAVLGHHAQARFPALWTETAPLRQAVWKFVRR